MTKRSAGRHPENKVEVLDATLRERTFGVSFAVGEKLAIASMLDALGVAYVESTFLTDDSKDVEYLKQVSSALRRGGTLPVLHLRPEYFEAKKADTGASTSSSFATNLPSNIGRVSFEGNCWQSHLTEIFSFRKLDPEENLKKIRERTLALRKQGKEVFFHATHYFDGFFEDTTYALSALEAAIEGGASRVILVDSRGSALPENVSKTVKLVVNHLSARPNVTVGVHCQNDLGLAVANTLAAVEAGAKHVEGTVNGLGERAGDADLCQVLPLLIAKLGIPALNSPLPADQQLVSLKALSRRVSDVSGIAYEQQPFVGVKAFAHSEPTHVSDVTNNPEIYEAINPALVGNSRRLGVDDASLILTEMWELGLYSKEKDEVAKDVLSKMRELEAKGYKFDDAKASVHLLILDTLGVAIRPFEVLRWETSTVSELNVARQVTSTIEIGLGEGERTRRVIGSAKGVGPIHATDLALRKALENEFPELKELKLVSYSLNIVDSLNGTAAAARARTEFADQEPVGVRHSPEQTTYSTWATVAVSDDVLDASIRALIDCYRYKLIFRSKSSKFALPDWKVALSWRYSERC